MVSTRPDLPAVVALQTSPESGQSRYFSCLSTVELLRHCHRQLNVTASCNLQCMQLPKASLHGAAVPRTAQTASMQKYKWSGHGSGSGSGSASELKYNCQLIT
jgi:hypothetical protein